MKSIFKALACAAAVCLSSVAMADAPQVVNHTDADLACDESGSCVVFEVTVNMDTSVRTPIIRRRNDILVIGNSYNPYGSVVTRTADKCSKQVRVPRPVFEAIMQIMRSLYDNESGDPSPAFTPAQQTILLFYTTIMQQTLQFRCTDEDVGS